MTDCSMCGDCCEDIALNVDLRVGSSWQSAGYMAGRKGRDWAFIQKNFVPTGDVVRQGKTVKQKLKCLKFDPEKRICTAHDERPDLCRNYPWYGGEPVRGDTTMKGRCSYLADAYDMLPIVAVYSGGKRVS